MSTNQPAQLRLSGLVLFGDSQLLVGLSDARWLRIPLIALPKLKEMDGEARLDCHTIADADALHWPRQGLTFNLTEFWNKALSVEYGDVGPR